MTSVLCFLFRLQYPDPINKARLDELFGKELTKDKLMMF